MIKRIGLLTSGGDCQALNATMRGVVKGLSNPYTGRHNPRNIQTAIQTVAGSG